MKRYHGCLENKDVYIEERLEKLLKNESNPFPKNEGWRIFPIKELSKYPFGTIFEHSILGKGFIDRKSKLPCMNFQGKINFFHSDDENPWDQVMRIVEIKK